MSLYVQMLNKEARLIMAMKEAGNLDNLVPELRNQTLKQIRPYVTYSGFFAPEPKWNGKSNLGAVRTAYRKMPNLSRT